MLIYFNILILISSIYSYLLMNYDQKQNCIKIPLSAAVFN